VYKRDSTSRWEARSLAGLRPQQLDLEDSPWIPVPAPPPESSSPSHSIHPPSQPSDQVSTMRSLSSVAILCMCLAALPCMVYAIPLDQFYRYGTSAGDAVLRRNDDGVSPPIPLGSSGFRYYRIAHSSIFVSSVSSDGRFNRRSAWMWCAIIDGYYCWCAFCRLTTMDQYLLMEACPVLHPGHFQWVEAHHFLLPTGLMSTPDLLMEVLSTTEQVENQIYWRGPAITFQACSPWDDAGLEQPGSS
jgi:hypothetical protein